MPFPLLAAPLLGGSLAAFGSAGGAAAAAGGAAALGGGAAAAGGLGSLFSSALPGLLSIGSGALGARNEEWKQEQQFAAKQQTYLNQVGQQKASDQFARWTASRSAEQSDTNNSYGFWQQQVNYNSDLAYTSQLRNFELAKVINQAEVVSRTRSSAMADYANQSGALVEQLAQQSMADAVSLMQYKQQALRSQASAAAGMNEGMNVDRYINDYARQAGDMEAMRQLNGQFREQQFTRAQASQIANYLNQYNSQQLYEMQEINDPMEPFPPLPTLVNPGGPSFMGQAPVRNNSFFSSAMAGVDQGMKTFGVLSQFTNSGKGK